MDKPRICEILGVEVGEKFKVKGSGYNFYVSEEGSVITRDKGFPANMSGDYLVGIINVPSLIIRVPRFTPDEMATLRMMKKAGITIVKRHNSIMLSIQKEDGAVRQLISDLLPSLAPDTVLFLDEMDLEDPE